MAEKQPLERKSFAGGFTSNLYGAGPNQFAYNDNLLVDKDEKAFSRPGSTFGNASLPQVSGGAVRVSRFLKFSDESRFFLAAGSTLNYVAAGPAWGSLTIPRTTGTRLSYSEWRSHLILTYDDLSSRPSRVSSPTLGGTPIIDLCGLPSIPETDNFVTATLQTAANVLANEIRTDMLAHFADTSLHRASDTVASSMITTASATDLTTLLALTTEMLRAHVSHAQTNQTSSLVHYLQTPDDSVAEATEAAATLDSYQAPTNLVEAVARLNNLKRVYNTHAGESIKHTTPDTSNLVTTAFITSATQGPSFASPETEITAYALKIYNAMVAHYSSSITATSIYSPFSANFAAHPAGTDVVPPPAVITQDTLADYIYNLRYFYYTHDQDAELSSGWSFHDAMEESDHSLSRDMVRSNGQNIDLVGGVFGGNYVDMVEVLNDLKSRLNSHIADLTAHYDNTAVPTVTPPFEIYPSDAQFAAEISNTSVAGDDLVIATYLYAFVLFKSHVANGDTFDDYGPVLLKQAKDVIAVENTPLVISNIPIPSDLTHSTKIYRTTDGGVTFFLVGEVDSATTTFSDNVSDAELIDREPLYTTGGVVENDPPPKCKYVHAVNDTAYYGNIVDSLGIAYPNRVVQSIPGNAFSAPEDFYKDFEDEVRGISSVANEIPIIFCKDSFHRLEGQIDQLGRGALTADTISNSIGLVAENSIVRVEAGLIFAGTDGFYFTDGYQYKKLTDEWNPIYQALTSSSSRASQITGTYDAQTKRVFWGVQRSSSSSDNDQILCLDLNFPMGQCWTSWSNGSHFAPTALMVFSDELYRGDSRGYWFKHQTSLTEDKYINTAVTPSDWGTKAIVVDLQDTYADFGTTTYRKWGTKLDLCMESLTDLNLAIQTNIDSYRQTKALTPVAHTAATYTAPDNIDFGTPSDPAPKAGTINITRRFPSGVLRFTHKQMRLTNDDILIEASTVKGPATPNTGTKIVTLDNGLNSWLSDPTGYYISFAGDSFTNEFEIIRRNSNTQLTVSDPGNLLVAASDDWRITGQKKGQKMRFVSYTHYAQILDSPELSSGDA